MELPEVPRILDSNIQALICILDVHITDDKGVGRAASNQGYIPF
jgi:hypothetical protein